MLINPAFRDLPGEMLNLALERISKEAQSNVLRRSAGIPPLVIAILRSEPNVIKAARAHNKKWGNTPISEETALLNNTLTCLLGLAKDASNDDSKVHAFNIMKFIF